MRGYSHHRHDRLSCMLWGARTSGATHDRLSSVGSLSVYTQDASTQARSLEWKKSGDQGDVWLSSDISLSSSTSFTIVLEATVGSPGFGDIAVDDTFVSQAGFCDYVSPLTCDFEAGWCEYQQAQDDDLDWSRAANGTVIPRSKSDSFTATEYYASIHVNNSHTDGEEARIYSPLVETSARQCLMFWYYMYGDHDVGMLNVYIRRTSALPQDLGSLVWRTDRDDSADWFNALVALSEPLNYQIPQ
ncbi:thyroid hormone-induced protein B-like [Diadema setosum]|uniref:thyroid hormone-induced protein B-like n=1 Tax=Diadema setosum TaxID=31175 RepID=UPI003B3A3331